MGNMREKRVKGKRRETRLSPKALSYLLPYSGHRSPAVRAGTAAETILKEHKPGAADQ